MFSYLFTKANFHRLIGLVVTNIATSVQALLTTGWTWHALVYGTIAAMLVAIAGWYIGTKDPADTGMTTSAAPTPPIPPATAGLLLLALLSLATTSCSPPQAQAAPVLISGPMAFSGALLPGDSLGPYVFSANSVPGATGYKWTVTASATNGAWTNLPNASVTTSPGLTFTLSSGGAWDSVSLQLCVTGTSSTRSAKAPACTSWKVMRYLPSPTSLVGDSSRLGPISFMLRLPGGNLPVWGSGGQSITIPAGTSFRACSIWRFGSGHVAAVGPDTTSCGAVVAAQFNPTRINRLTAAEAAWVSGSCNWSNCLLGLGSVKSLPDALLVHRA